MTHQTQTFAIADPRTFEGDPYEVAERAARQAAALARLLKQTTEMARLMIRNADMQRQLDLDGDCDPQAFEQSAVARKLSNILGHAQIAENDLNTIAKAAGFNPKARIGR